MQDTEIVCADCQTPFPFSAQEQEFYQSKGFSPPKRCKTCRQARKDRGDRGGHSGNAGGGSGQRHAEPKTDRDGRELHDVTCSDCGAATSVPFKPRGDKPVYCRDCFRSHKQ